MNDGGLFLPSDRPGYVIPATGVDTDVHIEVNGLVARTRVTQRFVNPTEDWVEGVYIFPLPEDAAVDRLRMLIGERQIIGDIMEREAARQAYTQARDAGQRASLVSQERPNIFTNAVANIAPGDAITVEIEYQETLDYRDEAFSLRFPMVVLPRYIPGRPIAPVGNGVVRDSEVGTGWSYDTDRVPDASRITPPVAMPGTGPVNPLRLSVDLAPGFPVGSLDSPFHDINVTERPDGSFVIDLAHADTYATRDFELVWRPVAAAAPTAGIFSERSGDHDYHLIMMMPPETGDVAFDMPREMVFVIDTSGSMAGASIIQAREALGFALDQLGPDDRFNIIAFNNQPTSLFTQSQPVTLQSLDAGRDFVSGLVADGGTEMRAALNLALTGRAAEGTLRQIVFITDGSVGNEAELFAVIHGGLGNSRLFTVGIGSAPNSFFMQQAAEIGRGSFTYIGATNQVAERMGDLFARLASPALTDINVTWPGSGPVDMYPAAVPDLYRGEPVIVSVRTPAGTTGDVTISGDRGEQTFVSTTTLDNGRESSGIAALWARARIDELESQVYRGADRDAIARQITDVALRFQLVSAYTSLVAIDPTVVRPAEEPVTSETIATNMPDGVELEMADAPAPAPMDSLGAIRSMASTGSVQVVQLPVGSTLSGLNLLFGTMCLFAALLLLLAARRWVGWSPESHQ
jgi:Ca-activated chloride channel family protein